MPYKSDKQRRFFEMCRHSPAHAYGKCPDSKTLSEYHNADKSEREAKKDIISKGGK